MIEPPVDCCCFLNLRLNGYALFERRAAGAPLAQIARLLAAGDNGDNEGTKISLIELNQYIQDARNKVNAFEQSLSHIRDKS